MKQVMAVLLIAGFGLTAGAQTQFYCKLGLKKDGIREVVDLGFAVAEDSTEAAGMWDNILEEYRNEGYITDYVTCKKKKASYQ